jgi:hypothetical protein
MWSIKGRLGLDHRGGPPCMEISRCDRLIA